METGEVYSYYYTLSKVGCLHSVRRWVDHVMIDNILKAGNPVSAEAEAWIRSQMGKIDRYRNLEPKISHFTVETCFTEYPYPHRYVCIIAWKSGRKIPIPKSKLKANSSLKTKVLGRLRKVIDYQMQPMRVRGMHLDHVYPFEAIVTDWLQLRGLSWEKVASKHYPDFAQYHLVHATYQLLTPDANLKKGNKKPC